VSLSSSLKRYLRIAQHGVLLAPRKAGGRPPKTDQITQELLEEDVKERPAATLSPTGRRRFLESAPRGQGPAERLYRKAAALKKLGLSQKTDLLGAVERDEWLKAAWKVTLAREITAERLVFSWTRWGPTPPYTRFTPALAQRERRKGTLLGATQPQPQHPPRFWRA
jgi:transposase